MVNYLSHIFIHFWTNILLFSRVEKVTDALINARVAKEIACNIISHRSATDNNGNDISGKFCNLWHIRKTTEFMCHLCY